MFPDEFEYHRAESVDHALELLAEYPGAEILAGGHSLLPTMKSGLASPDHLVDVGNLDAMRGIETDGETVSLGALTTYADVAGSDAVRRESVAVAEAAHAIGDVQVRNRGTVGGNVAHADPASDLPGAMLAADATLVVTGPDGPRHVAVDDFFEGMYATAVGDGELLTRIELPSRPDAVGTYVKKPSPSSGYAMVGVAAMASLDGDVVDDVRVGANGVVDHGIRLEPVEDALEGNPLDEEAIDDASARAGDDIEEWMLMDDIQASAEFRSQLLEVYTERALSEVAERAGVVAASR
jgi:carbon-monoxide dehydrogenase medium subunit